MVNVEIRNKFFDLINNWVNQKVADEYKNNLLSNRYYRFAIDDISRINFLKKQMEYDFPQWNPYTIKGVRYENGIFKLIESEIDELIIEYRINLSNYDFGEFENDKDKHRIFEFKSYNCLLMSVFDCLTKQIVNEIITELENKHSETKEYFEQEYNQTQFELWKITNQVKQLAPNKIDLNNDYIKPFREVERYQQFLKYMKVYLGSHELCNIPEISFITQALIKHDFIEGITRIEFAQWLFDKGFISYELFEQIDINKQLTSYKKTYKSRINNFNSAFNLNGIDIEN